MGKICFSSDTDAFATGTAGEQLTKKASVESRFPLGSYFQMGGEILRVRKDALQGTSFNKISVIRGALGSNVQNHDPKSVIRKIKPLALEVRRPSILRASGSVAPSDGSPARTRRTRLSSMTRRRTTNGSL